MTRLSNADKQRAYRHRKREGLIQVTFVIPHKIAYWLVENGFLDQEDFDDPQEISAALERAGFEIRGPSK